MLRTLSRILLITLVVAMVLAASALLAARAAGFTVLSVQTGSMSPLVHPGDAVIVKPARASDLRIGQIVSYHNPTLPPMIITHRLVRIDPQTGWLITKGDHLKQPDSAFPPRLVMGRAVALLPGFGRVLNAARTPFGLTFGVYVPATLIVWAESRRLVRHYRGVHYHLGPAQQ